MIANLASLAITIAALLFALSLLFGDSDVGRSLRRGAAFTFVMAFVPSVVICLLAPITRSVKFPLGSVQSFLAICGALAILGVFVFAAYGFLELRSHARFRQPRAHGEQAAYSKRRPPAQGHDAGDDHE